MKKQSTLLAILLYCTFTTAQINFTPQSPAQSFQQVDVGAVDLGDIENDGDLDLVLTGNGSMTGVSTTIYTNDGNGIFTESTGNNLVGVMGGKAMFEDVDNDGFLDLLTTGNTSSPVPSANLYMNDGSGNFTLVMNTPFEVTNSGDFDFGDLDGDGDRDLIMTGKNDSGKYSAMYLNNGAGVFSEVAGISFENFGGDALGLIDVENDNDLDVVIAGVDNNDVVSTRLYVNDGDGNFTLVANTPFEGCSFGVIGIADSDNDGDMDILVNGASPNANTNAVTNLYENDGDGNFSLVTGTPFPGTNSGDADFADFDADGDVDVLVTGVGDVVYANIYENLGNNNFAQTDSLVATYLTTSAIGDIDGDDDLDVVTVGTSFAAPVRQAKVYINETLVSEVNIELDAIGITVLPNPTQSTFEIQGLTGNYNIQILDVTGAVFQSLDTNSGSVQIDITTLPAGLYFVQVVNRFNDLVVVRRILKQ